MRHQPNPTSNSCNRNVPFIMFIFLIGLSDKLLFFQEPHAESEEHVSGSGYIPVGKAALSQIIGFGKQKQIACVVITPRL